MDEKELMKVNEEIEDAEEIEETPEHSGIGTGWAMLIGSGLTLAAIAAGKKVKKVWLNYKAKKELEEVPDIFPVEPEPIVEPEQPEPIVEPEKKKK